MKIIPALAFTAVLMTSVSAFALGQGQGSDTSGNPLCAQLDTLAENTYRGRQREDELYKTPPSKMSDSICLSSTLGSPSLDILFPSLGGILDGLVNQLCAAANTALFSLTNGVSNCGLFGSGYGLGGLVPGLGGGQLCSNSYIGGGNGSTIGVGVRPYGGGVVNGMPGGGATTRDGSFPVTGSTPASRDAGNGTTGGSSGSWFKNLMFGGN